MTVWTNVSLSEANAWLQTRKFEATHSIIPIAEGVEDSIYRLNLKNGGAVCLRLFERTEPVGPLSIAALLAQEGLLTCPPLKDGDGRLFALLNGKPAALFPWVDGALVASPSLEQIKSIGIFMGNLAKHGSIYRDEWKRENPRGWKWFRETAKKLLPVLDISSREELKHETEKQIAFWNHADQRRIPHGPVHADLFRNNVLFDRTGKLAAVIDWGFCASHSPLIYDLAIVANDWCLKDKSVELDPLRLDALMRGRESIMPLTEAEKEAWPMALRLGALRFYLSRLHDYHFPRNENGKALDPDHFHKILRARQLQSELGSTYRTTSEILTNSFIPKLVERHTNPHPVRAYQIS